MESVCPGIKIRGPCERILHEKVSLIPEAPELGHPSNQQSALNAKAYAELGSGLLARKHPSLKSCFGPEIGYSQEQKV